VPCGPIAPPAWEGVTVSDLRQAIESFDRAVLDRDAGMAATLLDAECARLQVEPAPGAVDRQAWLTAVDEDDVRSYEVLERFVHEDGDTAAVLQLVRLSVVVDGANRAGTQAITDVWRLRPSGWRLWRRHVTPDPRLAEEQRGSEAAAARAAAAGGSDDGGPGPGGSGDHGTKATVTEIAAVLAAIADAGEDPNSLTMEDVEQYVQAFRALKDEA
jgi:ketosteroid isomerase-like protein